MKIVLESQTKTFLDQLSAQGGKPIYQLSPKEARSLLEALQSGPIDKKPVHVEEREISGAGSAKISLHILRPEKSQKRGPVIVYFHGAGWVMGSRATHDRLARELVAGCEATLVFVNYSRSPEARYPVALEEAYAATKHIAEHAESLHLDASRLVVAGDSVGGNMAIAVTLLAKERDGPKIQGQLLFYPVTSAGMDTPSYQQFAEGPWLTKKAMEWFWDAYEPDHDTRKKIPISPLLARSEQLEGLPQALVITAENDVLRDEGEQYALKLMEAKVNVTAARFLGTIHDFVMLHALAHTPAALGALLLAKSYLRGLFDKD